ncbi:peptidoglycan-associated lipoprotein Pal [Roseibium sp.]|uniref:peptidoglycan-associated lipoprotein Pal n=1 Tax=Roseibium sp. TaxID=1936156 RepID=UPI003A969047
MLELGKFARGARMFAAIAGLLFVGACAQTQPDGPGGNVAPGTGQDFVVNVGDRVFFEEDKSTLNAQGQATLDKQAQWLAQYSKYTVTVEGHADERGTRQYNIALGARRAAAAREYLVSRGVAATRIKTISYGKERPVAVCNDNSCWSQNRRAVTVLNNATN